MQNMTIYLHFSQKGKKLSLAMKPNRRSPKTRQNKVCAEKDPEIGKVYFHENQAGMGNVYYDWEEFIFLLHF